MSVAIASRRRLPVNLRLGAVLVALMLAVPGVVWFLWPRPWPARGLGPLLLGCVAVAIAFVTNFCVQALFGMLGFWVDKSDALFGAWFSVWLVLSGYIAPLAVYPPWAQTLIRWSPFRGMLGLPVELLAGELGFADGLRELAVQATWLGVLLAATSVLWRLGVRRYGAFGA